MNIKGVSISEGNTKLGKSILSVNMPVGTTCRPDAPCYKVCYARHGRFLFRNVQKTLLGNYDVWERTPATFEEAIITAASLCRYFRWHSSGDIVSPEYFAMMCRVAKRVPDTSFLVFTKKYEIVNKYAEYACVPENLRVVYSVWDGFQCDNPLDLPTAHVRLRKGDNASIPKNAHACPKYCGNCAANQGSCWKLQLGESVVFDQH